MKENKSRFVGLAGFHSDYPNIIQLGHLVKQTQSQTILLIGNAHSTINSEDFLYENSPFDIAVLARNEQKMQTSEWSDPLSVSMPKNKKSDNIFYNFFIDEIFYNFPLLNLIINTLKPIIYNLKMPNTLGK